MNHHTALSLVAAENKVVELFEQGQLPYLLHLSGGNESELINIFYFVEPGDWVLSTHRAHYHFLLKGGSTDELINQIKSGKSMFLYSKELNFLSSSIVAGLVSTAVGLAMGIKMEANWQDTKKRVWCFIGDGGEDEGHFYEAVRFAQGHQLPVTFIIESNDRSVETSVKNRWGKNDIPMNWPYEHVVRYSYVPRYPHAGTGGKMVEFSKESIETAKTAWNKYYARTS